MHQHLARIHSKLMIVSTDNVWQQLNQQVRDASIVCLTVEIDIVGSTIKV